MTEAEHFPETETTDEPADDAAGEAAPELIATHYLNSIDDVVDHIRAAHQLGLGVRVQSYLEHDDDGQHLSEAWEIELLTSSAVRADDTDE